MTRRRLLDDVPTRDIGPYRLAHRIAVGSVAEIYRALWPQTAGGDRAVVIKRLRTEAIDDPDRRAMFEDEIQLGSRIDHPNVVAVLDHGVDDGAPYMVLEYVFGVDLWRLARWVHATGRELKLSTSLWIGTQLLSGLAAVHAMQDERGGRMHVVHRDVSPSNVFLSVHGDVKLGDLGIARAAVWGPGDSPSDRAKGKLGYLSPEQVDGRAIDQRSDVFSAAVVLAELLTGRPLFRGSTEIAVLLAIRDGDLRAFRSVAARLPEGLAEVVLSALERRPEHRTRSAEQVCLALTPFLTQPAARCREELGALVVGALDAETSNAEHHALKDTIESALDLSSDEPPRYAIERAGQRVGEYGLAELVRAVTTGEIQPTDRLRLDGGEGRSVMAVPEIARHVPSSRRTPSARRMTTLEETAKRWELSTRSMVSVLAEVLRDRESGLLLCERGEVRKEVYLEEGVPAFVTSNQPTELIGEQLVSDGVVARHELDLALAALSRYDGRLGEALVGMGLLHPVELVHHLSEHSRQRLLQLFEWTDGHAALHREIERPERAFRLEVDPWVVLIRGMARRLDVVGPARFDLERAGGQMIRDDALDASAPEALRELFDACAQPRGLAELEDLAPTPAQARVRVALLLEIGALKWRDPNGVR